MHSNRIISALIVIPLIYLFILWGGLAYYLFLAGLTTAGVLEFYKMCESDNLRSSKWMGIAGCLLLLFEAYLITGNRPIFSKGDFSSFILTLLIAVVMFSMLLKDDIKNAVVNLAVTLSGVMYVGWMLLHALLLREIKPYGFEFMIIAVVSTWFADTGAYFTGMKFGIKRKLHRVSPNKSRAGALGSVVFAMLGLFLMKHVYKLYFIDRKHVLILGALVGTLAVLGDLSESLLKRSLGQKDSGRFLPGHGGVLDRIDSMLFTIPAVYYYLIWFVI
jgi:phosphatidate cytidylyltransferase